MCDFFEKLGFNVTRHAYGLETAFEVIAGSEGRVVNFNAEYDALPDIGHACGHNLICISSVAGFLALAFAINKFNLKGRAQLLGTPAEEDGGGKVDLLKAGAYAATNVSLMMYVNHFILNETTTNHLGIQCRTTLIDLSTRSAAPD